MTTVATPAHAFRITTRCRAYEGAGAAAAAAFLLLLPLPPSLLEIGIPEGEPRTQLVASTHVATSEEEEEEELLPPEARCAWLPLASFFFCSLLLVLLSLTPPGCVTKIVSCRLLLDLILFFLPKPP